MATIKIKFKASQVEGKEGRLFYQVIHHREARQIRTEYTLFPDEWNPGLSQIIISSVRKEREPHLSRVESRMAKDIRWLKRIIAQFEQRGMAYTSGQVVQAFQASWRSDYFFMAFVRKTQEHLWRLGRYRTSETYQAALNSFMCFRENEDVFLEEIDSDLMLSYEAWLKSKGVVMNTISFYMRVLRAAYNKAVECGLTTQQYPFRHVYTGIAKTVKRAVPLQVIRRLKALDLSDDSKSYARDIFLFSFYMRGMSFVDMAFLRKKDLKGGVLSYRRKKTGQLLFIKWEPCMQEIVERYSNPSSPYLLSIIKRVGENERRQYINEAHRVNKYLREIGKKLHLKVPLTLYVARHAWASIAKSKNIPISVISEGMGHDSETTTRIYLASLDTAPVDRANGLILKSLV